VLRKVRFERYPRELLPRLIHHVYTHILQDSRLSRYYLDKSRVLPKLESSIRQVFLHGCSRFIKAKVLGTHAHMGISNRDFDLYIGYFGEAMRREGVSVEDQETIKEFLQGFRQYVVQ
jgi:truncated hemoglobin YjbI